MLQGPGLKRGGVAAIVIDGNGAGVDAAQTLLEPLERDVHLWPSSVGNSAASMAGRPFPLPSSTKILLHLHSIVIQWGIECDCRVCLKEAHLQMPGQSSQCSSEGASSHADANAHADQQAKRVKQAKDGTPKLLGMAASEECRPLQDHPHTHSQTSHICLLGNSQPRRQDRG